MATKRKVHHHKTRRRKMSGIGGNIETAVYVAVGAIAGEFLINTINTAVGKGSSTGGSDYIGDAAVLAVGVMVPAMMKGSMGSALGMGMVAAGALNIAQDAGLIAGVPMVAGNYSNKPPYAERHVRWCERTVREIIPHLLLDCPICTFLPTNLDIHN